MNQKQLSNFINLVDIGDFNRAEDLLNLKKTTLKKQINCMEKQLKFSLFTGSSEELLLTDAGEKFYHGIRKLYADYNTLVKECLDTAFYGKNSLRVGIFVKSYLSDIYMKMAHSTGIPVELHMLSVKHPFQNYLDMLKEEKLDFIEAEYLSDLEGSGLYYQRFTKDSMSCIVSPAHPLSRKHTLSFSDLMPYNVYCTNGDTETTKLLKNQAASHDMSLIPIYGSENNIFYICKQGGIYLAPAALAKGLYPLISIPLQPEIPFYWGLIYRPELSDLLRLGQLFIMPSTGIHPPKPY